MKFLFVLAWFLSSALSHAGIASEPWPKKLRYFPAWRGDCIVKGFKISRTESPDQDGAGNAGGIYDFTVRQMRTGQQHVIESQSVGVRVLELYRGWPQLEIWSRGGGGDWSRTLYRYVKQSYRLVRTDGFTEFDFRAKDKQRTTTLPGGEDLLYFVETRLPDKQ